MGTIGRSVGVATCAMLSMGMLATGAVAKEGPAAASGLTPAEVCVPATIPFDADDIHLTGRWSGDNGAIYYVRQAGDKVWLSGMSDYKQVHGEIGREVSVVGYGTLTGTEVSLEVADVPRGNVFDAGTIKVTAGADADGDLRAESVAPDGTVTTFTPCEPEAIEVTEFVRPFSYVVPFGLASWNGPAESDLKVMFTPDVPESGISFWVLGPGWEVSCSAPGVVVPSDADPASVEAYLRAVPGLAVDESSATIVAGQPATVVDVTAAADATGCDGDEYVRMFRESGNESGLSPGRSARLVLLDAGDATFVIELWGPDPETWWPIAQRVVDSVELHLDTAPEE